MSGDRNKYLNQGKELQEDLGLNTYDFHARMYEPAVGRTWQLDPHADNYLSLSPYSWVANNPLTFTDPTGMDIGLGNLYEKDDEGNFKYESAIRAFELFATSDVGQKWIKSRAQEGFSLDFAFEEGGINIEKEGSLSKKGIDYDFSVANVDEIPEVKKAIEEGLIPGGAVGLTQVEIVDGRLKNKITLDSQTYGGEPNAYSVFDGVNTIYHEVGFHGNNNEVEFVLNGKRDVNSFKKTGNHSLRDLERSPYGQRGLGLLKSIQERPSLMRLPGYKKYGDYKILQGFIRSGFGH